MCSRMPQVPGITDVLWNSMRLERLKLSYAGFGITPSSVRYAGSLRSNPTLVISAALATELIVNNVSYT